MRTVAVTLSVAMLAGSVADAQARGFRLRSSSFSSVSSSAKARRIPAIAAVGAISSPDPALAGAKPRGVMTAQAEDADENAPIPPMPPAPEAVPVTKPAQPWCATGRTVGVGKGFCLIN
ncbi:hypothetical protein [Methylobacterium gnaphalii]|uniref:Uncharacterized protein n=1 Tax=Methylobacterium gnaphalii TaxID=1010610 RepID=A0A512JFU1_9HYPH|nr:hypothetical protein [Methylobacterium gnaphalii]GEP08810.1 hypothetical protein MGN01_06550 [Methylobacterium gnaphalii]GJD69400.1 hypothetical protein MMMDOFMJ_2331 [Methylobacterium gnaphalii]GLS47576.1 hypothetical protein GCM10007885_04200 [Methylobacterium gnaphalii]